MIAKLFTGTFVQKLALPSLLSALLLSVTAQAQVDTVIEVEIDRDANELSDLISGFKPLPNPTVAPQLDTAMVLTSINGTDTWAYCSAKDNNGKIAGRVRVRIPAGGARYFLGSDIVDERGFVGSVICTAAGWVVGTEIMLGVITSSIEVQQDTRGDLSSMLFPVIAVK